MKQIIVGIDFSQGSVQALEYAIKLSNITEANICMLWVDNQTHHQKVFGTDEKEEAKKLKIEMKNAFDELVDQYKGKLKKGNLIYKLKRGKVSLEMTNLAKRLKADLIIIGTHGITGFEEFWIGSNANRIVMHAPCSVITIKYNYDCTENIKTVLMPIDSTQDTIQKVPETARFAKMFDAEVHILALYNSAIKSLRKKVNDSSILAKNFFEKQRVKYEFNEIEANDITNETLSYIEKHNINLITIMTEQGSSYADVLLGQDAQKIVNYSPVPVLSIHPSDNFNLNEK